MFKKIIVLIFSALLLANNYGCIALLAGAAGAAGTAAWLSDKLSQEVNVPLEKALKASKSALKSLKLKLAKETITGEFVQVMSNYSDGRTVWIDLRRVSDEASRIEVRVGAAGDKEAARKILERILKYL